MWNNSHKKGLILQQKVVKLTFSSYKFVNNNLKMLQHT